MKQLKVVLLSMAIGVAIGVWFGVNIGREVPLLSNPFDTSSLNQKIKKVSGETLEKTGQSLQDKLGK